MYDRLKQPWASVLVLGLALGSLYAFAEVDANNAEEIARKSYLQRFSKFTQDKNVLGKPRTADGKRSSGGPKQSFDKDDGNPYQSDLTYHDFMFNTDEEKPDPSNPGKKTIERTWAFISPHGGVSAGGGSSILERVTYAEAKKYEKSQEKDRERLAELEKKTGVKELSLFKVKTLEVLDTPKPTTANNNTTAPPEKIPVERYEIRDESRQEIEKVGEQSFETVQRAARDEDQQDNPKALANGVLLRYAASAATAAWWNSTLANLGQRVVNKAVKTLSSTLGKVELSESSPNCESWGQNAMAALASKYPDPQARARAAQNVQKMIQECNQLAQTNFNVVNPTLERGDENSAAKLTTGDVKREDPFQRDLRNQLEVMKSAGTDIKELQSNYPYTEKDNTARVTLSYDDNMQKKTEGDLTVKEQLDSYNEQLAIAADAYDQVKTRMPDLNYDREKILSYQIKSKTKTIMEVNQPPASAFTEEMGVDPNGIKPTAAETYNEVVQQSQQ